MNITDDERREMLDKLEQWWMKGGLTNFLDTNCRTIYYKIRCLIEETSNTEAPNTDAGKGPMVTREQVADIVDTIIGVYGAGKGAETLISWLRSVGVEVTDAGEEKP